MLALRDRSRVEAELVRRLDELQHGLAVHQEGDGNDRVQRDHLGDDGALGLQPFAGLHLVEGDDRPPGRKGALVAPRPLARGHVHPQGGDPRPRPVRVGGVQDQDVLAPQQLAYVLIELGHPLRRGRLLESSAAPLRQLLKVGAVEIGADPDGEDGNRQRLGRREGVGARAEAAVVDSVGQQQHRLAAVAGVSGQTNALGRRVVQGGIAARRQAIDGGAGGRPVLGER